MKTRTVKPFGMLYSQHREYFLLQPFPIRSDSWEWEGEHRKAFRFVVVPKNAISQVQEENYRLRPVYSHARHIVTTAFNIEYADMPEILVAIIELELSEQELDFKTNLEECEHE